MYERKKVRNSCEFRYNKIMSIRRLLSPLARLHWFTWCVLVATALPTLLLIIIGIGNNNVAGGISGSDVVEVTSRVEEKYDSLKDENAYVIVDCYQHGWPWTCLTRGQGMAMADAFSGVIVAGRDRSSAALCFEGRNWVGCFPLYDEVAWSNFDNWPLHADVWQWNWKLALLDLLVGIAIVGGMTLATERWLRWRGGLFRFRLIELLAFTTLVAVGFGYWKYHDSLKSFENRIISSRFAFTQPFGDPIDSTDQLFAIAPQLPQQPATTKPSDTQSIKIYNYDDSYCGPTWLSRLLGCEGLVPDCFWHITFVSLDGAMDNHVDWKTLGRLQFVKIVTLNNPNRSMIESVTQLKSLNGMSVWFPQSLAIEEYRLLTDTSGFLGSITPPDANQDLMNIIGGECIDNILQCRSLKRLELDGPFDCEQVARLVELPRLRTLVLQRFQLTPDEREQLKSTLKGVEIEFLEDDVGMSPFE